jgi:hypothetical protein
MKPRKPTPRVVVKPKKPTTRHTPTRAVKPRPAPKKKASKAMTTTDPQTPRTVADQHNPALVRQGETPQSRAQTARGVDKDRKSVTQLQAEESQAAAQRGAGTGEFANATRGREYNQTPDQFLAQSPEARAVLDDEGKTDVAKNTAPLGTQKNDDKK